MQSRRDVCSPNAISSQQNHPSPSNMSGSRLGLGDQFFEAFPIRLPQAERLCCSHASLLAQETPASIRFWSIVFVSLLALWTAWLVGARVPVYAASERARLEAVDMHWVEASVSGEIRAVHARMGTDVVAGDVLLEVDAQSEILRGTQASAHHAAQRARVDSLQQQVERAEASLEQVAEAGRAAAAEARAGYSEASQAETFATSEARRTETLFSQGVISEAQRESSLADAKTRREATTSRAAAMRRIEAEHRVAFHARQAELQNLHADLTAAVAQVRSSTAANRILEQDVERRLIRSPITGRVATEISKTTGSFIRQGERLTSIVPTGEIRAIGHFRPGVALGRVRPGQRCRFRLEAFPLVEYGWIRGRVDRIGSEAVNGLVQIAVVLDRDESGVHLEHGLTGSLEIETERVSPLALIFRAAGRHL